MQSHVPKCKAWLHSVLHDHPTSLKNKVHPFNSKKNYPFKKKKKKKKLKQKKKKQKKKKKMEKKIQPTLHYSSLLFGIRDIG